VIRYFVGSLLLLILVACQGFAPAQPQTLQRLRAMSLSEQIPCERFVLEIESPYLAGVFDVLCVVAAGSVRVQLFPEVGGKVMDLSIAEAAITAQMPGQSYRAEPPFDDASPHLALLLAAMLGELRAPVVADRVLGEQVQGNGRLAVLLRPALGSGRVIAELAHDGRVAGLRTWTVC
jgi:hypothetical protein